MHDSPLPELELLRLFDYLARERHVTRAAQRAGITQPAMSRALGRLRDLFGDPLFVRGPRGVVPTARAEALVVEVREVLARARSLTRPAELDPATLERTFVLGTTDFIESTLLPRLARRVAALAPRVRLVSRPLGRDAPELLASGRLDLLITPRAGMPSEALTQHLFDDGFVCAVRADHPRVQKRLSLSTFVELSHVLIAPRGEPGGPVERALGERGLSRHVAVETSSFLAAPVLVAETDLVLTGPKRVLEPLAERFGLALFAPPLELGTFPVHQGFHPRAQSDAAHAWLRGLVVEAARTPRPARPKAERPPRAASRARGAPPSSP